jgi:hypothetical protein
MNQFLIRASRAIRGSLPFFVSPVPDGKMVRTTSNYAISD